MVDDLKKDESSSKLTMLHSENKVSEGTLKLKESLSSKAQTDKPASEMMTTLKLHHSMSANKDE